eukprot:2755614-Prymnesium_polylepis.1
MRGHEDKAQTLPVRHVIMWVPDLGLALRVCPAQGMTQSLGADSRLLASAPGIRHVINHVKPFRTRWNSRLERFTLPEGRVASLTPGCEPRPGEWCEKNLKGQRPAPHSLFFGVTR